MRQSAHGAHPPRFEAPIDLEEHITALPPGGTLKGMFVRDPIAVAAEADPEVDLFAMAGVEPRRVLPFFDYSYADHIRLLGAACAVRWPNLPLGEGLRRIGKRGYPTLLGQNIGRVLFAAFGSDFGRVVATGAKGWKIGVGFGEVTYEHLGEGHGAYHMREIPLVGTYQVGVVEGAMEVCGVEGEVWARVDSLGEGVLEFWWR